MTSLCEKVKLQNDQFKSLKLIFCVFKDQFKLEGQDQGHQFSDPSKTFRCLINSSSKKVKFEVVQCLTVKIKILEV